MFWRFTDIPPAAEN